MKREIACAAIWAVMTCRPLLAHPGHGSSSPEEMAHFLLEPIHAPAIIFFVLLSGLAAVKFLANRRELNRRRVQIRQADGKFFSKNST